jgi:excisionase family DNA binding protein
MRLTISEAAQRLRVSEMTIRRRIRSGEIQGVQVNSPGGFAWVVDLPDEPTVDEPSPDTSSLRELVDELRSRVAAQDQELEARRREVQELHVLLQQAQAALPAPQENQHSWWYKLWHRNGR